LKVAPFGTFYVPNISSHPKDGIGSWTVEQFARAMVQGVSPDGRHYYPAFPYTSYQRMAGSDLRDLLGYIKTLPAMEGRIRDHDLPFPVSVRRSLGGWKFLFLDGQAFRPDPVKSASWNRGAYLVEGPGHCAECHSPRNILGVIPSGRRFSGGPDAEGKGFVPNITPHETGIKTWSKGDIEEVLSSGLTPGGDSIGGVMAPVTRNFAELAKQDRLAVAEYLLSLPPLEKTKKP
jgi:mono/diheme cytochrome c family protein